MDPIYDNIAWLFAGGRPNPYSGCENSHFHIEITDNGAIYNDPNNYSWIEPYPLPLTYLNHGNETNNATDIISFHAMILLDITNVANMGLIFDETVILNGNTIIIDYNINLLAWYNLFLQLEGYGYTPCTHDWHINEGSIGASVPFEVTYALDCCTFYPPAPLVCLPALEIFLKGAWHDIIFDVTNTSISFQFGIGDIKSIPIRLKDGLAPGPCCVANDAYLQAVTLLNDITYLAVPDYFTGPSWEIPLEIQYGGAGSLAPGTYELEFWYTGCGDPNAHIFKIKMTINP